MAISDLDLNLTAQEKVSFETSKDDTRLLCKAGIVFRRRDARNAMRLHPVFRRPNVDGDRYEQDITVKKNAFAHVATGAATKLAEMKYNYSGLVQNIVLEENAYLEFMPEPVIPCRHTRFISDTRLCVDETATVFYSEIFMGGRKYYGNGELFEYDILSVCDHGERPDGKQLFREKFIIDPRVEHPRNLGVMGKFDVFANVIVITPQDKADKIYDETEVFIDNQKMLAAGITRPRRMPDFYTKFLE